MKVLQLPLLLLGSIACAWLASCGSGPKTCQSASYPLYCPHASYCCPSGYPYDCNGQCYENPPTTECGTSYDTCTTNGTPDAGNGATVDGLWHASWSYTVGNWWTGTINATDCQFVGSTSVSVGGALGSGNFMAKGSEQMTCSNAATALDYNFGGYIDPSGVISGNFYYWSNTYSVSFAGSCTENACSATGSDSFALSLTRTQ
jgi:hypothetical protein